MESPKIISLSGNLTLSHRAMAPKIIRIRQQLHHTKNATKYFTMQLNADALQFTEADSMHKSLQTDHPANKYI